MITSKSITDDLKIAMSIIQSDTSATWLRSAANMLDHIAERIRAEIAAQPSPDFPPVE